MASLKAFIGSQSGSIILGLFGILLSYAFATMAIDSGSLWQYFITFLFLVLGLRLIFAAAGKKRSHDK